MVRFFFQFPFLTLRSLSQTIITFLFPSCSFLLVTGWRLPYCCSCFLSLWARLDVRTRCRKRLCTHCRKCRVCLWPRNGIANRILRETDRALSNWASYQPVTEAAAYTTQQMNIHAHGGIRARDPSSQAASDREEYPFHGIWHNIQTTDIYSSTQQRSQQ